MENSGGKTAAFAGATQLLLQCGLCQQWRQWEQNSCFCSVVGTHAQIICKFHRSLYRVIRISVFRYTEVLLYVYYVCIMCEYVCMSMYVCMYLASECSERNTYRGNTIENRGCLFIYIYVWTYVCNFVL